MGDFELLGDPGDETRLLRHACGYSLPIPGNPEIAPALHGDWPPADLVVRTTAAPLEFTFRLDEQPGDDEADALAKSMVLAYAADRTAEAPRVLIRGKGMNGPGIDGGAGSLYPLRGAPGWMEECHVVVHREDDRTLAMVRTIRFRGDQISDAVYGSLISVIRTAEHWDAAAPRTTPPPSWPEQSAMAVPGLALELRPELAADTRAKARALSAIPEGEGIDFLELLRAFANKPEHPRAQFHPLVLQAIEQQRLRWVLPKEALPAIAGNLADVKTGFDFSAWVKQCLIAFEQRHQST